MTAPSPSPGPGPAQARNILPGFGLPLNYVPPPKPQSSSWTVQDQFPSVLNYMDVDKSRTTLPLTTLREFTMLRIMNEITDKPEWHVKVFDDTISAKWHAEFLSSGQDVTPSMADWIIAELRSKASLLSSTGFVTVYNGDVVKSDSAVPASLKLALQAAVAQHLENVPEAQKDWHPGSDGKVWDLVHPSLYPLVYGRSRILPEGSVQLEGAVARCGEGVVIPPPKEHEVVLQGMPEYGAGTGVMNPYSAKFQWLPCEVDVDGEEVKIVSYINNLHPVRHAPLYPLIARIITLALPLWGASLGPLTPGGLPHFSDPRISYTECEYDSDVSESDAPDQEDGESDSEYEDRKTAWLAQERAQQVVLPEPGKFDEEAREHEPFDLREFCKERGGRRLQVIVKLANIELTPEKPRYEGGAWHVEGQLNEHIVATALYYYSAHNTTPSSLAFRQQSNAEDADEISYEQDHHSWLTTVFGCEQYESAVQVVGSVDTREGRLLTFPNVLQHQVQPFELVDKTQRGWRKIVALFLVDPHLEVVSTQHVPPQRADWWGDAVCEREGSASASAPGVGAGSGKGKMATLPAELQQAVLDQVEDFPISFEEAKRLRLELMEERSALVQSQGDAFEENKFSLCEH